MRVTQGTFSFLPDFTDEEIEAQIKYALRNGWAVSVEYTDDPHPRNTYWEMWNQPLFDLDEDEAEVALREVHDCREAFPDHYIKVIAYDARHFRQTTGLSFIVNRPKDEPGFHPLRTEVRDRVMDYRTHAYATEDPAGRRYGRDVSADGGEAKEGATEAGKPETGRVPQDPQQSSEDADQSDEGDQGDGNGDDE
jgi:ribulose-bisphosphate carboxylase small chain